MTSRPLGLKVFSMSKSRLSFPGHRSHPYTPNSHQLAPSAHSQTHRILELESISAAIKPYLCQDRPCLAQSEAGLGPGHTAEQNSISGVYNPTPRADLPKWPEFIGLNLLGQAGWPLNSNYQYRSHQHSHPQPLPTPRKQASGGLQTPFPKTIPKTTAVTPLQSQKHIQPHTVL